MRNLTYSSLNTTIKNILENNEDFNYSYMSNSKDDTIKLGELFGKYLKSGNIIVLNGDLGSGKTIFVSGIAKHFKIDNEVSSPTFNIVNEYITKDFPIYHFDVYRLESEDEFLLDIGTDYFSNGACIIEWGNIILNILPKNSIFIDICKDSNDQNKRYFNIWRKK